VASGDKELKLTDDSQIRSLIKQLDEAIPREGQVEVFSDEPEYPCVRANRIGYLRLGVEFLKAAEAPTTRSAGRDLVDMDLGYLTGLEEHCYSFERREDVWSPMYPEESSESSSPGAAALGWLIGLAFVASLVVGAYTILRWLGSALF
jgi:hypothetical protein